MTLASTRVYSLIRSFPSDKSIISEWETSFKNQILKGDFLFMIDVRKDELRVDEVVLKWATNEEMAALRKIAEAIADRVKTGGVA